MRAVVLAILLVSITYVLAADFTTFVKENKPKIRKIYDEFTTCKRLCSSSNDVACFRKCAITSFAAKRTYDTDEEVVNAMFDEVLTEEQVQVAETQADAHSESQSETQSSRSTNAAAVNLIKSFEGFRSCVYLDAVGKKTIGYGHLIKSGESFTCISQSQAETLLKKDLASAESCVSRSVSTSINDNQFGALVSFTFNLGCGSLQSSTLLKKVNARASQADICYEFSRWNKAGGKVLPGLTRRRQAECDLYKR